MTKSQRSRITKLLNLYISDRKTYNYQLQDINDKLTLRDGVPGIAPEDAEEWSRMRVRIHVMQSAAAELRDEQHALTQALVEAFHWSERKASEMVRDNPAALALFIDDTDND